MQLNCSKASLDIPNKLVRLAHQPLAIPLTLLYNQSIMSGIEDLKGNPSL